MKLKTFNDYTELSSFVIESAIHKKYVVVAMLYDEAMLLIKELLMNEEIIPNALEIVPPEYEGYADEYYISLCDDMSLSVEPAMRNERYLFTDANFIIISEDSNSKILLTNPDSDYCIVNVGCECECSDCEEKLDFSEHEIDLTKYDNVELITDTHGKVIGIRIK